jgi:glycosyltransferase involved in cell wall biosynthesis
VDLGNYYDIDVVVEQGIVTDDWVTSNYAIRNAAWFDENAWRFDRILYQFGNSSFHEYQLPLLRKHPGTVVLHDSFIGAFSAWRASKAWDPGAYLRRLYQSHGYAGLLKDAAGGRDSTIAEFPSSLEIIRDANGVVVHSQYAIDRASHFYSDAVTSIMRLIAFPKKPHPINRVAARAMLGLAHDEFVVCSLGMIAPTKLNGRLLSAWLDSSLARDEACRLIFVGENHGGDYGQALAARIEADPAGSRIRVTGFVEAGEYRAWIEAADLAVQLRTDSRGETSAAVFDCMAQGLPLIVNAHATFAELDPSTVFVLPDQFSHQQLVDLLQHAYESMEIRQKLGGKARSTILTSHHPDVVARHYRDALEHFAVNGRMARERDVADAIARLPVAEESDLLLAAQALSRNHPALRQRQLLVDVTATARNDLKTGIERVTRNIVREWIGGAIEGLRVEPVRFHNGYYVYASEYTSHLLGIDNPGLTDEIVAVSAGDIFFGLDWVADIIPDQVALFQSWRDRGVGIYFTVYDLLPVLKPQAFPPGIEGMCATWLRSIASCADGLCCISKAVANELIAWLDVQQVVRARPLAIGYYHLGAELDARANEEELPQSTEELLGRLAQEPTVLMVGTVEPRKGHAAALDAFNLLWQRSSTLHLTIIGKQGWMTDELAACIRQHPEFGRHLHWLSGVSDGELGCLYEAADVLLAASEGEGFGLPLIEAARRQLPIIARDIPVFREVAGSSALYFAGADANELARVIESWFSLNEAGKVPSPGGISWLSWKESAVILGHMAKDRKHPNWLHVWPLASKVAVGEDVGSVISAPSTDASTHTMV